MMISLICGTCRTWIMMISLICGTCRTWIMMISLICGTCRTWIMMISLICATCRTWIMMISLICGTCRTWIQLNIGRSRQNVDAVHHVREDIVRLCDMLHDALSLREIRWDSVWGITHFRGCLKSFSRLYAQNPKVISTILEGASSYLFPKPTNVTLERKQKFTKKKNNILTFR